MASLGGPHDKETAAYMRMRKAQNLARARNNPNECEAFKVLKDAGKTPSRQAVWSWRIFDFWWSFEGVALEMDGAEHDPVWDEIRDRYNFARSGILVYRAVNGDMVRVRKVADAVKGAGAWDDRRPEVPLYKTADKASVEWGKIREILDPRRAGTAQPPIRLKGA